jgi:hypothetical protein
VSSLSRRLPTGSQNQSGDAPGARRYHSDARVGVRADIADGEAARLRANLTAQLPSPDTISDVGGKRANSRTSPCAVLMNQCFSWSLTDGGIGRTIAPWTL